MRLGSACASVTLLVTAPLALLAFPSTASPVTAPPTTHATSATRAAATRATRPVILAAHEPTDHTHRTTPRWAGALDPRSRSEVTRALYADYVPPWTVPTGSTGNPNTCTPGTTSAAYRTATLRSVNFMRNLAGLAPVTEAAVERAPAQAAALLMAANHSLSHSPPSTWRCWTRAGHDGAGRSNLAEGFLTAGSTIRGYMSEPGANNPAVGHRRWILNPFSRRMGVGAVQDAEALSVINRFDTSRPNPAYIGWPTAHWFPYPLEPHRRWSLSAGDSRTRFDHARVTVLDGSTPVAVHRERPVYGYAQPTVVWEMPAVHNGHTYTVTVTGMTKIGVKGRFSTSYTTHLFTPVDPTAPVRTLLTPKPSPSPTPAPSPSTPTPTPTRPSPAGSTPSCFLLIFCGT
ncbi:MAG: CAP domain-containing protein [Marmoricola sp.]